MMHRLNFDMALLEHLTQGVLLLDRTGKLLSHNTAAQSWAKLCVSQEKTLRALSGEASKGFVKLPAKLNLFAKPNLAAPPADAWLCKNGRFDYAIFLVPHPQPEAAAPELVEQRYVSLLGEDLRQQMTTLRTLLRQQASDQPVDLPAISAQTVYVDQLLQEISDLSMLTQRVELFNDDRLDLSELIEQVAAGINQQQHTKCVTSPGQNKTGVVYGNAAWIGHALRTLFQALCASAPPLTHISISLRQMGGFALLTGKVMNQFVHRPQPTEDHDVSPQRTDCHRPGSLLIARRVIELHAGKLKMTHLANPPTPGPHAPQVESFVVTLPTGQAEHQRKHLSCAECPMTLQAQAYAQDLATLLAEQHPPSSET